MTQEVSAPRVANKTPTSSHVSTSKPSGQKLASAVGESPALRRSTSQPVGRGHSCKVTLLTKETTVESTGSSTNEEDDDVRYVSTVVWTCQDVKDSIKYFSCRRTKDPLL